MKNRFFNLKNGSRKTSLNALSSGNSIFLYDVIGEDYFGGISALSFSEAVNAIEDDEINIYIDSAGGDVFAAQAMVATIIRARNAGKNVTAHIDGLAASSASWIAIAADRVIMSKGAFFMMHNSWGFIVGNAGELRQQAGLLDKIDAEIVAAYAQKSGLDDEKITEMMEAETWLNSAEALELGFANEILEAKPKDLSRHNLSAFDKAPKFEQLKNHDETQEKLRAAALRRLRLIEMN
jgi:ATP-dependent Clp protease protease subunit